MARILVVDDDPAIRQLLTDVLEMDGYEVSVAVDGLAAVGAVKASSPDFVVLDVMMPGLDGFGLLRALRVDPRTERIPVIMLFARAGEESRVEGIEAGADDYLVKPFVTAELELRLRALLRRRPPATGVLRVGDLVVDADTRTARRAGIGLELTRREFDLLEVLARNAGVVLSRDRLLELVWGYDFDVGTNAVDTFVSYLRRKLESGGAPRLIHTVRGVGFLLRRPT